jgi:hypothetical protein
MTWFAAHIIIGFIPDFHEKLPLSAWENVILLEAESESAAMAEANQVGKDEEALDDELTIDGKPARRFFAGVRKLVRISNEEPPQDEAPPRHRTEITYSEFKVKSFEDLKILGSGDSVALEYLE